MKNKSLILGLVSTIALTTTAKADNVNCYEYCKTQGNTCPDSGDGCRSRTYSSYGTTVYYSIDDTVLTVYGSANGIYTEIPTNMSWSSNIDAGVTSLRFQGNISNISTNAFVNSQWLTSVDLTNVKATNYWILENTRNLASVVLPDSFFDSQGNIKTSIKKDIFANSGVTTFYCPQGKTCSDYFTGLSTTPTIISYTQDSETGIYTVGDKMYATALDLTNRICTGTGNNKTCTNSPTECTTGIKDCQIKSLKYQGDKCTTERECSNLIDMVSDSQQPCDSISTCYALAKTSGLDLATLYEASTGSTGGAGGSSTGNSKRIYTVEEARQAVEAAGTDTVNVRIRYK